MKLEPYKDRATKAQKELEIYNWLVNHNVHTVIDMSDTIYYDHKDLVVFGWKDAVSKTLAENLEKVLKDIPFPYKILGE